MTKLLNLARLDRKLKRLPEAAKQRIRPAMERAAAEIVAMMKSLVRVDDGDLKDSIGWTWGKAPRGSMVIATVRASLGGDMTLTIYAGNSDAYYARWVEFGTKPHINQGLFPGTKHPGTEAKPFFYVSYRANRKGAKAQIRQAVRQSARQVASGG
ncbi:HK97 gp10 family phage protein [Pararhizobium gei]|uniref:HK97 gp10 family phage protein n=1 Tax=Pararhizobium gei TaxID=1395951 RepID=UPI0023DBF181|nr:HK97 gp10 family phage protein [Rhizobium gei]